MATATPALTKVCSALDLVVARPIDLAYSEYNGMGNLIYYLWCPVRKLARHPVSSSGLDGHGDCQLQFVFLSCLGAQKHLLKTKAYGETRPNLIVRVIPSDEGRGVLSRPELDCGPSGRLISAATPKLKLDCRPIIADKVGDEHKLYIASWMLRIRILEPPVLGLADVGEALCVGNLEDKRRKVADAPSRERGEAVVGLLRSSSILVY